MAALAGLLAALSVVLPAESWASSLSLAFWVWFSWFCPCSALRLLLMVSAMAGSRWMWFHFFSVRNRAGQGKPGFG